MEDILAIVFLFGGGTLFLLSISPIGRAFADRIRARGQGRDVRAELVEHEEALEQELEAGRGEVGELGERGGFAGPLLGQQRGGPRIRTGGLGARALCLWGV